MSTRKQTDAAVAAVSKNLRKSVAAAVKESRKNEGGNGKDQPKK